MKNLFVNILVAGLCAACSGGDAPGSVGTAAPDYAAQVVNGPDSVRLARLNGSVVLLNVWATWCVPCRREVPELQALHERYTSRGLWVVGVSIDDAGTDSDVAEFMQNFGMHYTVLRDPQDRVSDIFRIPGVPASFLIDRSGIVRWRRLGAFSASDPDFLKALQRTL